MNIVALIPARAGSKRVANKNRKLLAGKRLIDWTVEAATQSGVFSRLAICSDEIEHYFNTSCDLISRPPVSDTQPDIEWVRDALDTIAAAMLTYPDAFAILRPTSPFRTADTIRRAWAQFQTLPVWVDSLRAVERWDGPHPGKMWYLYGSEIEPVDTRWTDLNAPPHSCPTQSLPVVVRQNASLEIARASCVTNDETIAGGIVAPFFTEGWEGFDINTPEDWERAEQHAQTLLARVP